MPILVRFCDPKMSTAAIVADVLRVVFPDATDAVDMTYGLGRFWNGSAHVEVTRHDLDPQRAPDGVMDFRDMRYGDRSFDVALLDPPHMADAGAASIMGKRFGTARNGDLEQLIKVGAREAWRICELGVIIKIADHVHGQKLVLESDWVRSALDGRAPYEVVFQTRERSLRDPRWGKQLSAYNNGATFLAFRKGDQRHIPRACRA
jgi:hypothetical protein